MAKEWIIKCKDCPEEFGYSDWSYHAGEAKGQSRPERCPKCRQKHNRQTALMGMSYFSIKPKSGANTKSLSQGSLGKLNHSKREHRLVDKKSSFNEYKFGVTEDNIREVFEWLKEPKHQVAVVVGPTGSGKSTALPYYLIDPPEGVDKEQFTRHGQVLITQPRIQATLNICGFVAEELYGSSVGAGYDVGYRYSEHPYSDWRNKLVYATDGTLINWIISGQISKLSTIVIDEAHERSLNIDLILGLLKRFLHRYRHLKLIVASATINKKLFFDYFEGKESEESDHYEGEIAKVIDFNEMRLHKCTEHFAEEDDDLEPHIGRLPYENIPVLKKLMPRKLADKIIVLLKNIQSGNKRKGDIIGFLQGVQPITEAVKYIEEDINNSLELKGKAVVFPLYTTLSQDQQNKALREKVEVGIDPDVIRVVITTNVAETSLTVPDLVYVVDSGLINQEQWDRDSQSKMVATSIHSKAGCRQRWGRGGRSDDGDAYCMYTKEQFENDELFIPYTIPQIQRSGLDKVLLSAKAAGISDIEHFDWIQAPENDEMKRALNHLNEIGALDANGNLTNHGLELQSFIEDADIANLMVLADKFSCAVEMATLMAFMKLNNIRSIFLNDKNWDSKTSRDVDQIQRAFKEPCKDDIALYLKIYHLWSDACVNEMGLFSENRFKAIWVEKLHEITPNDELTTKLGDNLKGFIQCIEDCHTPKEISTSIKKYNVKTEAESFSHDAIRLLTYIRQELWTKSYFINSELLKSKIKKSREVLLEGLSGHKKEDESRPIDFNTINKLRIIFAFSLANRRFIFDDDFDNSIFKNIRHLDNEIVYRKLANGGIDQDIAVKIGYDSVCYGKPDIKYFISAKNIMLSNLKLNPNCKYKIMQASFIAQINEEDINWILNSHPSVLELGMYLSQQKEKYSLNNPADSLLIDQYIRLGGKYTFTKSTDNIMKLRELIAEPYEVIEKFREEVEASIDDYEIDDESNESHELVPINEVESTMNFDEEEHESAGESLSDDNCNIDLFRIDFSIFPIESSENMLEISEAHNKMIAASSVEVDIDYDEESDVIDKELLKIIGYKFENDSYKIVCRYAYKEEPFALFKSSYSIGQEVEALHVVEYFNKVGTFSTALIVRDEKTRIETVIDTEKLTFYGYGNAIKRISLGTKLKAIVDDIDDSRHSVYLSCLPFVERNFGEFINLAKQTSRGYYCEATVDEIINDRVFVVLNFSKPNEGILHIGSLQRKNDYEYIEGETIPIVIRPLNKTRTVNFSSLDDKLVKLLEQGQGLFRNFSYTDNRLQYSGQMPFSIANQLKQQSQDIYFIQSIDKLYSLSNRLDINESVDLSDLENIKIDEEYDCKVVRISDYDIYVEILQHLDARLNNRDINNPENKPLTELYSVGETIKVRVISKDEDRISVSQLPDRKTIIKDLTIGQWIDGTINNIVDYGVFVALEGTDLGLLHKSEISGEVSESLSDNFHIGDSIKVRIKNIDPSRSPYPQVSLSMYDDPSNFLENLRIGDIYSGVVTNTKDGLGAFVEIYHGITGLIHISQGGRGLNVGQKVQVGIINIENRNGQMRLGFRYVY